MGKYVRENLNGDERVLMETGYHWAIFLSPAVMLVVVVLLFILALVSGIEIMVVLMDFLDIFLLLLVLVTFVGSLIVFKTTEFAVTNRRVIIKKGFIAREAMEIELNKIEGVNVRQSILGRVLGYGSLQVRGTGVGEIWYNLVDKPFVFQKTIDAALYEGKKGTV